MGLATMDVSELMAALNRGFASMRRSRIRKLPSSVVETSLIKYCIFIKKLPYFATSNGIVTVSKRTDEIVPGGRASILKKSN